MHGTEKNSKTDRIYKMWLALLSEGLRADTPVILSEMMGGARAVFEAAEKKLEACPYLTEKEKAEIIAGQKRGLPFDKTENWEKLGIGFAAYDDEEYPARLRTVTAPPYALWYRGSLPPEETGCVGIIGARSCSDYGRRSAEYFGRELAGAGIVVISGMAAGVDGISQGACLRSGGKSYGVLGSGPDVIYPRSNGGLYHELIKNGGVLSEFVPGTPAMAANFPRRNRIISALSDIILVIEARARSGTSITVNFALEQGRDVYALPGRVDDPLSAGCNRLIKDGAGVACCADDIIEELKARLGSGRFLSGRKEVHSGTNFDDTPAPTRKHSAYGSENILRQKMIRELMQDPCDADGLLMKIRDSGDFADLNIQMLMSELTGMEIEGALACRGGCYFVI
ncbi:MAG: DNA-processing protein DprA [Lachnospiraceae bacterium]|nr:DNA-processing protein DprA [Lachnospiraceae bacterium]